MSRDFPLNYLITDLSHKTKYTHRKQKITAGVIVHYCFICTCSYDYLKITNDKYSTVAVYCGKKTGRTVLLTGDHVNITFHTDSSVEKRGFWIHFYAVPHGKCNRKVHN